MALREMALNLGVKCKDTCKLFFGVYPYSLVLPVPQELIDDKAEAISNYNKVAERRRQMVGEYLKRGESSPKLREIKPSLHQIKTAFARGVDDIIARLETANAHILPGDHYVTFNRSNITIYVKEEATALALLNANKGVFSAISEPHSEEVNRFLSQCSEKRIVVRQHRFEGEFEFRIDFKAEADKNYEALDARVEKMLFAKKLYSRGAARKLYLNGEDDLILARMALDDRIETITKCVLRSEVPA